MLPPNWGDEWRAPKAGELSGGGMGRGVPSQLTRGLEDCREPPNGVRGTGQSPIWKRILKATERSFYTYMWLRQTTVSNHIWGARPRFEGYCPASPNVKQPLYKGKFSLLNEPLYINCTSHIKQVKQHIHVENCRKATSLENILWLMTVVRTALSRDLFNNSTAANSAAKYSPYTTIQHSRTMCTSQSQI